ncbi:hypothetical protein WJX72_007606 [[Myrmecia] bisecta]|uniref:Uncharacterized protein n=1 Tax=[Myrmecia] bisecta TaxID=41462 RepID=A0AAW1QAZ9_9CHLO
MGGRANSEALARAGKGSADDTYDTDLELAHAMSMQEFEFSSVHNGTFIALESAMHRSSRRLQYFCVSECLLTLVRWYYGKYPQALIGVANCLNHYTAATLIATGSKRFRKIYTTAGSDMHNLLRGLLQLSTVFHELSIISMALGILQIATAASIWKFVTVLVALFSVAVSGLRVITWHYPDWTLRCRHTFMRVRWLLSYHLRNCLRLATVKPDSDIPVSSALSEYELSRKQQQVIHRLIESMHVYGLACALQAASEVLLMAAFAHEGSVTAVLALRGTVNKGS